MHENLILKSNNKTKHKFIQSQLVIYFISIVACRMIFK